VWVKLYFRHGGYTELRITALSDVDKYLKDNGYKIQAIKKVEVLGI
jgi:hypothetical protein